MVWEKGDMRKIAEKCVWDFSGWRPKQVRRDDDIGAYARWFGDPSHNPKPVDVIRVQSRAWAEYDRAAAGAVDLMLKPPTAEATALLKALAAGPDDKTLAALADLIEEEYGPTPVELHKWPRWMSTKRSVRSERSKPYFDHWGRTVLFRTEILVTEPYESVANIAEHCKFPVPWDGIPFFAARGDWYDGTVRAGWFPRSAAQ